MSTTLYITTFQKRNYIFYLSEFLVVGFFFHSFILPSIQFDGIIKIHHVARPQSQLCEKKDKEKNQREKIRTIRHIKTCVAYESSEVDWTCMQHEQVINRAKQESEKDDEKKVNSY